MTDTINRSPLTERVLAQREALKERPKRLPAFQPTAVRPLPAFALELAPATVQEASEAHREALQRVDDLRRKEREAREAVLASPPKVSSDAQEAVLAVSADLTKTRVELEEAEEVARQTQFALVSAVNEQKNQLVSAAVGAATEGDASAEELLTDLERLLTHRRRVAEFRRGVDGVSAPMARVQHLLIAESRPDRDPLGGPVRDLLNQLRGELSTDGEEA